jgi:hypothetical protein
MDTPKPGVEESDFPKETTCPLSNELFVDPVEAADGFTYERRMI